MNISVKSFLTAIAVIFALMVLTYALTFIVPGGTYARTVNESGNVIIDTSSGFTPCKGGLPFWKWALSPFLVLGMHGNITLISVILFLLVIGGIFACLEKCLLMKYLLENLVCRFSAVRYKFMAIVMLFFMLMGSFIGSFEEVVPLVPIVVALSVKLGWDALTGVGMSLLAAGCGFAAGVCNPFSVGIAQRLASLPMFSGLWLRCISFLLIYALLYFYVTSHAKKIEKDSDVANVVFVKDAALSKAVMVFCIVLGLGLGLVISSFFFTFLQDYTLVIIAFMFLLAGSLACIVAKMGFRSFFSSFCGGVINIFPSVIMILMAASIKYTMETACIQDSLLHLAIEGAHGKNGFLIVLFLYFVVLVMNFFIGSASAKAFLMIPLLIPLANAFGISSQLCVLAFAFGDGFSNCFYPTNAALLVSLSLADVGYGKWAKYSWKFQAMNLVLTCLILLFGYVVGY